MNQVEFREAIRRGVSFPGGVHIDGDLHIVTVRHGITTDQLPSGLTVAGDMYVRGFSNRKLPDALQVGRWIDVRQTKIASLPADAAIRSHVFLAMPGELPWPNERDNLEDSSE